MPIDDNDMVKIGKIIAEQIKAVGMAPKLESDPVLKNHELEAQVVQLKKQVAALMASASELSQASQSQVHGMCEDQACEKCMGQGQEMTNAAYAQGQHDLMEQFDQWLILAGGEDLRQRVVELAARGQQLWERDQQVVKVIA